MGVFWVMIISIIYFPGDYIFKLYREVNKLSPFEQAMIMLYNGESHSNDEDAGRHDIYRQIDALLDLLYLSGRFEPYNIWQDLLRIYDPLEAKQIFLDSIGDFVISGATQSEYKKFNAPSLRKRLFKHSNISKEDILDWVLVASGYLDLSIKTTLPLIQAPSWTVNNSDIFYASAKTLGMIDRIESSMYEYDSLWILGSSRLSFIEKIIDFSELYHNNKIKIVSDIMTLATNRILSPSVDGIDPKAIEAIKISMPSSCNIEKIPGHFINENLREATNEGKNYILGLGEYFNIESNLSEDFTPSSKDNRNSSSFDDNDLKSSGGGGRVLNEQLMISDIVDKYTNCLGKGMKIIQLPSSQNIEGDGIEDAVSEATKLLIERIKSGLFLDRTEINILIFSENPFIQREILLINSGINKALQNIDLGEKYQVNVKGIGYENKSSVESILTEIALLIREKYKLLDLKSRMDHSSISSVNDSEVDLIYDIPKESEWVLPVNNIQNKYLKYLVDKLDTRP